MKDHGGCRKALVRSNLAWYANTLRDRGEEIMFGMYALEGGTSGEMAMRWVKLGNRDVPQLQVFNDA